jgi:hypothetical protein
MQLIMQLPPIPCCLVTPTRKYSPQHLILRHPKSAFLPQCQRPTFTPIQQAELQFCISSSSAPLLALNSTCYPYSVVTSSEAQNAKRVSHGSKFDSRTEDKLPGRSLLWLMHEISRTVPQNAYRHFLIVSVIKTSQLMLYREIIAVWS